MSHGALFLALTFLLATMSACVPVRQGLRGPKALSRAGLSSPQGAAEVKSHPGAKAADPAKARAAGSSVGEEPSAKTASLGGSVRKDEAWKDEMEGVCSWYGVDFNGRLTASGEVYDMYAMTAAHKTLPLGTTVKVHNLENGKSITVRVNDRGPYVAGRIIDLSRKAARALGMRENGTAKVRLEVLSMP